MRIWRRHYLRHDCCYPARRSGSGAASLFPRRQASFVWRSACLEKYPERRLRDSGTRIGARRRPAIAAANSVLRLEVLDGDDSRRTAVAVLAVLALDQAARRSAAASPSGRRFQIPASVDLSQPATPPFTHGPSFGRVASTPRGFFGRGYGPDSLETTPIQGSEKKGEHQFHAAEFSGCWTVA